VYRYIVPFCLYIRDVSGLRVTSLERIPVYSVQNSYVYSIYVTIYLFVLVRKTKLRNRECHMAQISNIIYNDHNNTNEKNYFVSHDLNNNNNEFLYWLKCSKQLRIKLQTG